MRGALTVVLTATREAGPARAKARQALLAAGFEPDGRAMLTKPLAPGELAETMATLRHLHREHAGITIRAAYGAEWTLT